MLDGSLVLILSTEGIVPDDSYSQPDALDVESVRQILRVHMAIIERRIATGLHPIDMTFLDMIDLGELEGRPYDASSISQSYAISRPTASRRLRNLQRLGYIEQRKVGRNKYYYSTQRARDHVLPLLRPILRVCQSVCA